jgi:hypothetical protein
MLVGGELIATVHDRTSGTELWRAPDTYDATIERNLDQTSTATLGLTGADAECGCDLFDRVGANIEWATELAFWDPDDTREPVWIGPNIGVLWEPDDDETGLRLQAYDRSVWWNGNGDGERVATGLGLTIGENRNTIGRLWAAAWAEANAVQADGLVLYANDPGPPVVISRTVSFGDPLQDLIDEFAALGNHWTVVGRRLAIGEQTWPEGGVLRGAAWNGGGFPTNSDGFALCNFCVVRNADQTIVATYPASQAEALTTNPRLGLHAKTIVAEVDSEADAATLARSYVETHSTTRRWATTNAGSLACDSGIELADLVPGRRFTVVAEPDGCVPYQGNDLLISAEILVESGVVTAVGVELAGSAPSTETQIA